MQMTLFTIFIHYYIMSYFLTIYYHIFQINTHNLYSKPLLELAPLVILTFRKFRLPCSLRMLTVFIVTENKL